jgi:glycosyltransferase involved in cell wall biosynthesis
VTAPDVTVVVAVYNTMPYLRETFESLVAQTIGRDRLEVVTVDDGSTDGSAEELDRWAADHPDLFRVIHQPNSGGPAVPSNRGLDAATGRFVYFLGADDYLGPEALERLVDYADEHESDIVIGKVVGVNGRHIEQRLFKKNVPDLPPYGPDLRWSMANTNLYRRAMIERIGLRYVENLPFGSDQPFMVEASANARRISVLADYTCYYAVARDDRANISYATPYGERLRCITALMETVERVVEAGEKRDTILVRHFTWEVPSLVRQYFHGFSAGERAGLCRDIAGLVDRFMTDGIRAQLRVPARVLLHLAARGEVGRLDELLNTPEGHQPPVHLLGTGIYAGYPGLSTDDPDPAYRVPDQAGFRERLLRGLGNVRATWESRDKSRQLVLAVPTNIVGDIDQLVVGAVVRVDAPDQKPIPVHFVKVKRRDAGAEIRVRIDLPMLDRRGVEGHGWLVRLNVSAGGYTVNVPVPPVTVEKTRFWHEGAMYVAWLEQAQNPPAVLIRVNRVPAKQAARAVLGKLPLGRK